MDEGVKLMSYDKNRLNSYFLEKTKSNKKMFILKHFLFDFQYRGATRGGRPAARPPLAPERGVPPPCRVKRKKEWRKSVSQE